MGCVGGDFYPAYLFAPLFPLQLRFIGANSASTTASGFQHLFFSPFPWTALPRELFLQLSICQISVLALRWSGSKPQQYPFRHGGCLFWPCSIPTDAAFARGKLRRYFQSTKKRKERQCQGLGCLAASTQREVQGSLHPGHFCGPCEEVHGLPMRVGRALCWSLTQCLSWSRNTTKVETCWWFCSPVSMKSAIKSEARHLAGAPCWWASFASRRGRCVKQHRPVLMISPGKKAGAKVFRVRQSLQLLCTIIYTRNIKGKAAVFKDSTKPSFPKWNFFIPSKDWFLWPSREESDMSHQEAVAWKICCAFCKKPPCTPNLSWRPSPT